MEKEKKFELNEKELELVSGGKPDMIKCRHTGNYVNKHTGKTVGDAACSLCIHFIVPEGPCELD